MEWNSEYWYDACPEEHFLTSLNSWLLLFLFYVLIEKQKKYKTSYAVPGIKLVSEAKLRHTSAVKLVEFVCKQVSTTNDSQFWQSFVSADIVRDATSSGIVEILRICFQFFPDLVWTHLPNEGFIVQIAIKNRQEKVFSLLCKMPIICKFLMYTLDKSQNTTSHLAARFASLQLASISGAAFQMQKELQWFKVCLIS